MAEASEEEPLRFDENGIGIHVPEHLYKYRALDIPTLKALATNRLYFVDYKLFNDPFDCQAVQNLEGDAQATLQKWTADFDALDQFRVCLPRERRRFQGQ